MASVFPALGSNYEEKKFLAKLSKAVCKLASLHNVPEIKSVLCHFGEPGLISCYHSLAEQKMQIPLTLATGILYTTRTTTTTLSQRRKLLYKQEKFYCNF